MNTLSYLPLVEITSSLRKILQEELGRERIHLNKNVISIDESRIFRLEYVFPN
jgi:hypothetical protein